jgi:hypothetical protein
MYCHVRRRIRALYLVYYIRRRRIKDKCMSYEEEDTCMSYEEEDTCMSYEEEDTCMSYEEEDTCMSYEEEDTCMSTRGDIVYACIYITCII